MKFFRKNLIDITIFILLQYFFITIILILLYTGGNFINNDATNYVWNLNYLSDLGRVFYFNENKNPFSFFYASSMWLVGIGTALYFYLVGSLVKKNRVKKSIIILGILSGLGYMLVGYYPVDLYLKQHISVGMLAFYSFFLAELLLIIFINKAKFPLIFYLTLLIVFLFIFRIILIFFIKNAGLEFETLLKLKTISQKILVYAQILVSTFILYSLKKRALYSGQ